MKITKQRLKQIIREELENVFEEQRQDVRQDPSGLMQPDYDEDEESTVRKRRVEDVQKWLGVPIDGVLGPTTRKAIMKFERQSGHRPRGELDDQVYNMIDRAHGDFERRLERGIDRESVAAARAEKMATKMASAPLERAADTIANLTGANKSRFIPDADLPGSAVPQGAKRKLAREKALKK